MAVAKPSVYTPRLGMRGTSPLQGALSDVAGAIHGLAARQEVKEKERKAEEEKEHKRKADLLYLKARNDFYEEYDVKRARGDFDGMTAAQVQEWGEEAIERHGAAVRQHDELEAERYEAKTRETLGAFTARQRDQEEDDAAAEVVAQYEEVELRAKTEINTLMREAMDPNATPREAAAKWAEIQAQLGDVERAHREMTPEDRERHTNDLNDWLKTTRFDAAVNHSIETGTVDEFFGKVANRTDKVAGLPGTTYSKGVDPDHIMKQRAHALTASRAKAAERKARLEAAAAAEEARGDELYDELRDEIYAGDRTVLEAVAVARAAGLHGIADKLEGDEAGSADRVDRLTQDEMNADPELRQRATNMMNAIGRMTDPRAVQVALRSAKALEQLGTEDGLSKDQYDAIKASGDLQMRYLEEDYQILSREHKEVKRLVQTAFKAELATAGVIGDAVLARLDNPEQVAFYYEMIGPLEQMLMEQGADAGLVRLVVNDWMPAVWNALPQAQVKVEERRGEGQFAEETLPEQSRETPIALVGRLTTALARRLEFKNDRESFQVLLDPEHQSAVKYDADGNMHKGRTIKALERQDPRPGAAEMYYEQTLLPMQRFWTDLKGFRTPEEKTAATKELLSQIDTR